MAPRGRTPHFWKRNWRRVSRDTCSRQTIPVSVTGSSISAHDPQGSATRSARRTEGLKQMTHAVGAIGAAPPRRP